MIESDDLLVAALASPQGLAACDIPTWNRILRQARRVRLLPQLASRIAESGIASQIPQDVQRHLNYGEQMSVHCQQGIRWEVNRIEKALAEYSGPVVLLKGAAYLVADLPAGRGRLMDDVDLLVPKARIDEVEARLTAAGWEVLAKNEYDDHYYRAWTHELPPLVHRGRGGTLDLHHNILPPTGRLKPDAEMLLAAARPVANSRMSVLGPEDMVLHSAAHLFQECDLAEGLRDLADLDSLLRHFARDDSEFHARLVSRGEQLQLTRPLYYAQYFTELYFQTPFDPLAKRRLAEFAPPGPIDRLMKSLGRRVFPVPECDGIPRAASFAQWLLLLRMHWLKMPPGLLLRHSLHKAWTSLRTGKQDT